MLVSPSLHDANLWKIELKEPSTVILSFRDQAGSVHEMTLVSVEYLKCDDFREGNIVLEVTEADPAHIDVSALRKLLHLREDETNLQLQSILDNIRSGTRKFIKVTPSYGSEITCLCGDFSLYSVP
jgi:hypothetical protein